MLKNTTINLAINKPRELYFRGEQDKNSILLTSEEGLWTAELVDANRTVPVNNRCQAIKSYFCKKNKIQEVIQYEDDDPELWQSKLEEI